MKTSLISTVLAACVIGLNLPSAASAEVAVGESIEWVIADSERVVIGKVVKVETVAQHEVATVEVTKTIRGEHEPKVTFLLRRYHGIVAKGWLEDGEPILFCLVGNDKPKGRDELPKGYDWVLRQDGNHPSAVLLGKAKRQGPGPIDVFTRDFGVLTEPAAILKHVEVYAKSIPNNWKKKHTVLRAPSESAVYKKLWSGSAVLLMVPVDPQLETQGRQWCKSDSVETRVRGAKVLGNFKNDENVKILRPLLQDAGYYTGDGKRRFVVRAAAYDALRSFSVKVEMPILEEPLDQER
jgi:hypothetical protein